MIAIPRYVDPVKQELAEVEKAEQALKAAKARLYDIRRSREILCICKKKHAIKDVELLVTYWYVEPYSCTGGDYWKEGEWQFLCPETNVRNRLMFDDYDVDYKDRDTVGKAAEATFQSLYGWHSFKSYSKLYKDENDPRPTCNNYYVDNNRELFELPPRKKPSHKIKYGANEVR